MADVLNLTPSGVRVTTRTVADPQTGHATKQYVVSYMVGNHGPFKDEYNQAQYTHPAVVAGIAKQVATLRAIHSGTAEIK